MTSCAVLLTRHSIKQNEKSRKTHKNSNAFVFLFRKRNCLLKIHENSSTMINVMKYFSFYSADGDNLPEFRLKKFFCVLWPTSNNNLAFVQWELILVVSNEESLVMYCWSLILKQFRVMNFYQIERFRQEMSVERMEGIYWEWGLFLARF